MSQAAGSLGENQITEKSDKVLDRSKNARTGTIEPPLADYRRARVSRQTADESRPRRHGNELPGPAIIDQRVHERSGGGHHYRSMAPALGRVAAGSPCAPRARVASA